VQVPEQVVVERRAHPHQALAVVDEQPDVELDARQLGDREPLGALAQPKRLARTVDPASNLNPASLGLVPRRSRLRPSAIKGAQSSVRTPVLASG